MVKIRTKREIDLISESCQIVADTVEMLFDYMIPGTSLLELDRLAEKAVAKRRALPRRPLRSLRPTPFATQGLLDPIPEKQEPTAFMHLLDVPKTRT